MHAPIYSTPNSPMFGKLWIGTDGSKFYVMEYKSIVWNQSFKTEAEALDELNRLELDRIEARLGF